MAAPPHIGWIKDTGDRRQTACGQEIQIWELDPVDDQAVLSAWAAHFRHHYCADADLPALVDGTNCGIVNCFHHAPDILARNLGVGIADLDRMAIDDPYRAVALDIAALQANPRLAHGVTLSGLVYDVANGQIQTVVAPTLAPSA